MHFLLAKLEILCFTQICFGFERMEKGRRQKNKSELIHFPVSSLLS